jgi:hypothetical protein
MNNMCVSGVCWRSVAATMMVLIISLLILHARADVKDVVRVGNVMSTQSTFIHSKLVWDVLVEMVPLSEESHARIETIHREPWPGPFPQDLQTAVPAAYELCDHANNGTNKV